MWKLGNNKRITLAFFTAIVAIKVSFLLAYGPIHAPDSGGYIHLAQTILGADQAWLNQVNLDKFWQPATAFRIIGYPAVIALTKMISPQNWDWILVVAQMGVSLIATLYLTQLAYSWSKGRTWIAYVTAIGHALGQGWVLDQCILTDSFNASLWVITASIIALGILKNRPPSTIQVLVLGILILLAFLMREAGNVLQVLLWPLVVYWSLTTGNSKLQTASMLFIFALPIMVGAQVYKSWNEHRTGQRFITTGGQTTLFAPMLRLKERGVDVFVDTQYLFDMPPLIEPISSIRPLSHIHVINTHLNEKHGMNALEIANYGYTAFFRLWQERPLDMIGATLSRLRKKMVILSFMPFDAKNDLIAWATNDQRYINTYNIWGAPEDFESIGAMAQVGLRTLSRVAAAFIFVGFVIGAPFMFLKHLVQNRFALKLISAQTWLMVLFWSAYMGYTFAYAAVSLEPRYLMPVQPFSTIIGLITFGMLIETLAKSPSIRLLFRK